MTEEESQSTTITNDDLDVLRVLLHNVRGLSAISTAASYTLTGDESAE